MESLWQEVELYLGTTISPSEWDSAKASAERKLEHIISLYGDSVEAQQEPWYLAQLIAEAVAFNRTSRILHSHSEQSGTKKEQPTHYT